MFKRIQNLFKKQEKFEISPEYLKWRNLIFSIQAEDVGIVPDKTEQVYGLILDIGLVDDRNNRPIDKNFVISISTFASIEASVRSSFGGGVLGIGANPEVAEQIKQLLPLAANLLNLTQFTETKTLPKSGMVYFYFLTTKGIRQYESTLNELNNPTHPFAQFFAYFGKIKMVADKMMF